MLTIIVMLNRYMYIRGWQYGYMPADAMVFWEVTFLNGFCEQCHLKESLQKMCQIWYFSTTTPWAQRNTSSWPIRDVMRWFIFRYIEQWNTTTQLTGLHAAGYDGLTYNISHITELHASLIKSWTKICLTDWSYSNFLSGIKELALVVVCPVSTVWFLIGITYCAV